MKKLYWILFLLMAGSLHGFSQDIIRLESYLGNLMKIEVRIGDQPFSMLFDTGGGETLISPAAAGCL